MKGPDHSVKFWIFRLNVFLFYINYHLFFDRGITPFDRTTSQKHCTVVPRLSEASPAVPRPSKIAGKGGKFKILQSAPPQYLESLRLGNSLREISLSRETIGKQGRCAQCFFPASTHTPFSLHVFTSRQGSLNLLGSLLLLLLLLLLLQIPWISRIFHFRFFETCNL